MKIDSFTDVLSLIRSGFSLDSDYQIAKLLGISRERVSGWRTGKSFPDDSMILRIENLLNYPPGSLLFELHAARSKCPDAANIFHQTAKKIAAGVLCFMLVFSVFLTAPAFPAGQFDPLQTVYYVKSIIYPNGLGPLPYFCFFTLFFVNTLYCHQIANLYQNDNS